LFANCGGSTSKAKYTLEEFRHHHPKNSKRRGHNLSAKWTGQSPKRCDEEAENSPERGFQTRENGVEVGNSRGGDSRTGWGMVAVDEAVGAPDSMEGIIHPVHRVLGTTIIGTSTTNEVVAVLSMNATAGGVDHG